MQHSVPRCSQSTPAATTPPPAGGTNWTLPSWPQLKDAIRAMWQLTHLSAHASGFTGPIGPLGYFFPVLTALDLGHNDFTGSLPHDLGLGTLRTYVRLAGNKLRGARRNRAAQEWVGPLLCLQQTRRAVCVSVWGEGTLPATQGLQTLESPPLTNPRPCPLRLTATQPCRRLCVGARQRHHPGPVQQPAARDAAARVGHPGPRLLPAGPQRQLPVRQHPAGLGPAAAGRDHHEPREQPAAGVAARCSLRAARRPERVACGPPLVR